MSDAPLFSSTIKISLLPSNCDILKILLVSFKSSKIEGEDLMIDSDSVMGAGERYDRDWNIKTLQRVVTFMTRTVT